MATLKKISPIVPVSNLSQSIAFFVDALGFEVRAPFDTDYGQREFHVIDPDVLLLSFGEPKNTQ